MDAATGDIAVRNTPMELCPDRCTFSWLPGDLEVAIGRRDPAAVRSPGRPDTVKDVAIYAVATGRLVRVVPVPGEPVRQDAWSSDGRLVLVYDRLLGEPFRVVEVRSGRTVGRIAGQEVHFLRDDRILSLTNETAELYDSAGRLVQKRALPDDLRDRKLSIGRS
jgi:hypothetical protein